jgi:proprotein convertase subtilisin/kexin type 5
MTLTFDCNYPCEECRQGQPDVCTKCNDIQGDMILYESKCYLQCPPGTFFEYFQCKLCDSKCKTCEYLSGTSCTTCDGDSAYPYLNGKDCSPTCSYGEFGNALTNECEACEVPCAECVETPNKCTTCRQDNLDKYFLDFSCREKCPVGYYVQLEARNNVCLECSDNCLECDLTADTCTKCAEGWILNGLDSTCVQECPVGTTIFSPATIDKDATCDPCKTSCKTCETTVDFCTSCRDPLSLDRNEAKCILECDIFEQKSVSVQNVCYGCSSSCETCQFSPDYCLTCVQGTYFYRNSCKAKCPMINDYQFTPSKEDGVTCVIEGLRCPFGWKVDEWGTGCELVNQVCETNYELNWDKSACIPISTFWIPFPIVITMAVLCIVPIVSKIKFKKHTLIVPSFTIFVSFCESVCIVVLVA